MTTLSDLQTENQIEDFSKSVAEGTLRRLHYAESLDEFNITIRKGRYIKFNPNLFIDRFLEASTDCC